VLILSHTFCFDKLKHRVQVAQAAMAAPLPALCDPVPPQQPTDRAYVGSDVATAGDRRANAMCADDGDAAAAALLAGAAAAPAMALQEQGPSVPAEAATCLRAPGNGVDGFRRISRKPMTVKRLVLCGR